MTKDYFFASFTEELFMSSSFFRKRIWNWCGQPVLLLLYSSCSSFWLIIYSFLGGVLSACDGSELRDSISSKLFSTIRMFTSVSFTSITSMRRLLSSGVSSFHVVHRHDCASAAWFLIPARWTTSNLYSDSLKRQRISPSVLSVRFSIPFRSRGSFIMVNVVFSKYRRSRSTAHTIAK